jgi:mannosidase alpha-like ER degradation enhancer 2
MRRTAFASVLLCLASPAPSQQVSSDQIAGHVKEEFLHAWQGYKKHAWGHDAYKPLSKTSEDFYGAPFYLTALEALDALNLMRLDEEADTTREFLATHLSFDKDVFVPVSEFASRVLGALIANYQLTADKRLLDLADDLGKRLSPAFISPTAVPYREVNLKTGAVRGELSSPEEIGTLFTPFAALGMITQKVAYFNYAKIALLGLYERRPDIDLVGEKFDISTGEWKGSETHLGRGIGAYYMEIMRASYLFDETDCAQMWQTHYAAINRYLLDSTATAFRYGAANLQSGKRTSTRIGASDALFPAAQALFHDFDRAERTMQTFYTLWTKFGLQPELYNYATGKVEKPGYALDPEITESAFTLYRLTGNPVHLQMAKAILDSIVTYCRTDEGYAGLKSILTKKKEDRLDPWFFSGTMKYLYLIFSSPDVLDFTKVMMTSRGHPIRKVW